MRSTSIFIVLSCLIIKSQCESFINATSVSTANVGPSKASLEELSNSKIKIDEISQRARLLHFLRQKLRQNQSSERVSANKKRERQRKGRWGQKKLAWKRNFRLFWRWARCKRLIVNKNNRRRNSSKENCGEKKWRKNQRRKNRRNRKPKIDPRPNSSSRRDLIRETLQNLKSYSINSAKN